MLCYIKTYMHMNQHIHFHRSKTNVFSFQPLDQSSHKHRPTFLTQRNIQAQASDLQYQTKLVDMQHQANLNKIQDRHHELNNYIEKLDDRVKQVMDHNEAEILQAYKTHFYLVKREMEQLRKQSEAQASSSSSHLERIQELQKKLAIFRQQSLILFQKVTERDEIIQQLKSKISELQNEKLFMDQRLKAAMKRSKELDVQLYQKKLRENQNQENFTQKFDMSMIYMNSLKGKGARNRNRTALTSANISKGATINTQNISSSNNQTEKFNTIKYEQFSHQEQKAFSKSLKAKLDYLGPQLLSTIVQAAQLAYAELTRKQGEPLNFFAKQKEAASRATKLSMRSKSNFTIQHERARPLTAFSASKIKGKEGPILRQKEFAMRNQVAEYFVECVQVMKKEIIKKKNLNTLNFYKQGNPVTLKQFKKLDWFSLMQLFLSESKVVEELYKILVDKKN